MRRESKFQRDLIPEIRALLPGCLILKNDPNYLQGVPDLTVLFEKRWGMLEVKASETAATQPNQEHYVWLLNTMSFAAFIHPGNKDEVLRALQHALRSGR